jgi:hypothetical protein
MPNTTPPDLLNDDGSASIATALLMSHHGFRRDIARFATALERLAAGDSSRTAALQVEWQNYHGTLHGHHEVEDTRIFPGFRSQQAGLVPVIDQLAAQHRRIDPLLSAGDRAFANLSAPEEAALIVGQLATLLDEHLALEEAHVICLLRGARDFPPPASDEELRMYAEGFAWASHGVAPHVLDRLYALLPEALRARLPGARASFAVRCERVWGTTREGASRTAVPELP